MIQFYFVKHSPKTPTQCDPNIDFLEKLTLEKILRSIHLHMYTCVRPAPSMWVVLIYQGNISSIVARVRGKED